MRPPLMRPLKVPPKTKNATIPPGTPLGLGWYRPEDWDRLMQVIPKRHRPHDSYAEWLAKSEELERHLEASGQNVRRVHVDPDELASWCLVRGRMPNSGSRAEFVTEKLGRELKRGP